MVSKRFSLVQMYNNIFFLFYLYNIVIFLVGKMQKEKGLFDHEEYARTLYEKVQKYTRQILR